MMLRVGAYTLESRDDLFTTCSHHVDSQLLALKARGLSRLVIMTKSDYASATVEHTPPSLPHLNFDILTYIMACITRRTDLLSLMCTCSSLYAAGIPALLRSSCSIQADNLLPFYEFLISKGPSSFMALRDLHLFDGHFRLRGIELSSADVDILVDVLQKATKLNSLTLDCGPLLGLSGDLPHAITSLTSLRSLSIWGPADAHREYVLTRLQSPLQRVSLPLSGRDIFQILKNFHHSLEYARLSWGKVVESGVQFTKLTHLELFACFHLRLCILGPALPNLHSLVLANTQMYAHEDEADDLREENSRFQQDRASPVWKLSYLSTDLGGIYALNLQLRVPTVEIMNIMLDPDDDVSWLPGSMSLFRPIRLSVWLMACELDDPRILPEIITQDIKDMRFWNLTVEFTKNIGFAEYMNLLVDELTRLAVHLKCDLLVLTLTVISAGKSIDKDLDQLDEGPIIHHIMDTIASLKVINFEWNVETTRRQHWLRHDHEDGVSEIVPTSHNIAKKLEDELRSTYFPAEAPADLTHASSTLRPPACSLPRTTRFTIRPMMSPSEHTCQCTAIAGLTPFHTEPIAMSPNFDTLTHIMACIADTKDLLAFMSTCADLYSAGIPTILGFPHTIHSGNLQPFYTFLVSKGPSSFTALRNLQLSFQPEDVKQEDIMSNASIAEIVADILRKSTKLQVLQLGSDFLSQTDEIYDAISSLTTLRVLTLWGKFGQSADLALTRLRSPLTTVDVDFCSEVKDGLAVLANFSTTLERATIKFAMLSSQHGS
ncbi:hypothetical protein NM688_g3864 [Phlebia brevispora]|uniref:Uncharacterized protein n=1 Tax=Phlebia brevispora TaxID=194682 RepID=A0ACC1T569_9APHY|nr:hypothetical protein NM688_g3864 [Phlebia brevispora]